MVRKTKEGFICEECGLVYRDRNWAEKCEEWCKEHNSCNLEVIKHSINRQDER